LNDIIKYIKNKINDTIDIAVVTGSGLSDLKNILDNATIIHYSDIPGYFNTTVQGHEGAFYFGDFKGHKIVIAVGRFHYYEGLSFTNVGLPIQIFQKLGCQRVILTNSAGCLQPKWDLGDIMIIDGHYDFTFRNDANNPQLIEGKKYYNSDWIFRVFKMHPNIRMGKYGWVLGPMYETKSEIINMKNHGVSAVGMSTVPEIVMASQLKLDILVLSLMSNYGVGLTKEALTHQRVLDNSIKYNQNFKLLLTSILSDI
tara:strand:- start:862 stop:1629 length:768 start_codon:yes stop_codon:yes gene_type:complete